MPRGCSCVAKVFRGKNAFTGLSLADAVDPRLSFRAGVYILFALGVVLE